MSLLRNYWSFFIITRGHHHWYPFRCSIECTIIHWISVPDIVSGVGNGVWIRQSWPLPFISHTVEGTADFRQTILWHLSSTTKAEEGTRRPGNFSISKHSKEEWEVPGERRKESRTDEEKSMTTVWPLEITTDIWRAELKESQWMEKMRGEGREGIGLRQGLSMREIWSVVWSKWNTNDLCFNLFILYWSKVN